MSIKPLNRLQIYATATNKIDTFQFVYEIHRLFNKLGSLPISQHKAGTFVIKVIANDLKKLSHCASMRNRLLLKLTTYVIVNLKYNKLWSSCQN